MGRERELAEVRELLSRSHLLTLTGTGGCGKTRLALEASRSLVGGHSDGVWLVELGPLSHEELVAPTVARVLGVTDHLGVPIVDSLISALKPKQLLLLIDNCEHLLDGTARLVERLLKACPDLKVLATSRQALGILGETCYRVPSLSLPDLRGLPPLPALTQYESVRLFVDRATDVQPRFAVTSANAFSVAQVCCRLDGIPLAIELAAARVRGMTVEQIASRLDDRFRLLTGGSRAALQRQQTLRAAIDWGYDLLPNPERTLLRRLAVFVGGFSLEAAEEVCSGGAFDGISIPRSDVLDLLLHLVDCSLAMPEEGSAEWRYRLLETIREYARDRLLESGEDAEVRDRHLDRCLAFAERGATELFGPEQRVWLDSLELEHDNLRSALDWASTKSDAGVSLRLTTALAEFWVRGWWHQTEGRQRIRAVLARPGGELRLRSRLLWRAGELESAEGSWSVAREWYEESLRLARELEDGRLIAGSLLHLSFVAADLGDLDIAERLRREALDLARKLGDRGTIAQTAWDLSTVLLQLGTHSEARTLAEESLANYRAVGNAEGIALCFLRLGQIALSEGDLQGGRELAEKGLARAREAHAWRVVVQLLGLRGDVARGSGELEVALRQYVDGLQLSRQQPKDQQLTVSLLVRMAGLESARGASNRAVRLFGAVHGWHEAMGLPVLYQPHHGYEQDEQLLRLTIDPSVYSRLWDEGLAMTLDQAVEAALAVVELS